MEFLHLLRRVRFVRDSILHLQGVRIHRVRLARTPDGVRAHLYTNDERVFIVTFNAETGR